MRWIFGNWSEHFVTGHNCTGTGCGCKTPPRNGAFDNEILLSVCETGH